jgi:hypothetical protein
VAERYPGGNSYEHELTPARPAVRLDGRRGDGREGSVEVKTPLYPL